MMLPREQRAERVQEVLRSRNLSRHAAHTRLDISRPAIDRMWDGRDVELEIIERFARGLRLDVNEWRWMWGHDPLPPDQPPVERIVAAADELTYELETDDLGWVGSGELNEQNRERLAKIAKALRDQQRKVAN
jgi:hypothetical protein